MPLALASEVGGGILGGLGLVAIHLLLVFPGGPRNPLYRTIYRPLYAALCPALRDVRVGDVVLLAAASEVGEELLFRGWLQTEAGIVAASLLFGAAHVWDARALPYGLYAAGMGACWASSSSIPTRASGPPSSHTPSTTNWPDGPGCRLAARPGVLSD